MRPTPPTTRLGLELRQRRGALGQPEAAALIGIPRSTLAGVERGGRALTVATAQKLAAWLGWTLEDVVAAADSSP